MISADRPVVSEESDSLGLHCESCDDALNHVRKAVKRGNDFLACNKLNIVEGYKKGKLDIHFAFTVRDWDFSQYDLVFHAVPPGREGKPRRSAAMCSAHLHPVVGEAHRVNDSVFIGVTELVQDPEQIIPSFVWLGRANHFTDAVREYLGDTCHLRVKRSLVVSDGIVKELPAESEHGLVKRGPQAKNSIASVASNTLWHRLTDSQLQQIVSAIRVTLGDSGAGVLVLNECLDFAVEIGNVILSPCDTEL